ncbi:short-chain fatty acyl-CoA regulator family protein [Aliiroseovarius sp. KMU-50]|uniref:Short-chain fatty acyl-CoA regulator family protein n=1 Tax=Aliiroseovarius salicola TaxID=3009082 RepID=A0ABT4W329_9RHOB|nr:short-chain fatty acyl-CoA regulator family protein [Aliiroseovarius sp. KMU-50]MDA5094202.1 short-chain fatty acyl-CoA regulator family protein [Aliiroseovarius sp. KMU-50]
MPQSRLTGSRIRERRLYLGQKQAALARGVGISAAYLNLIEHNRRRIGGKLLNDLARALSVDPVQLTEGAEDALVGSLRDAAVRLPDASAELDKVEDLAGRFPGWTGLIAAQHRRIQELELSVETLSDRLAHDPHLAASLHEVISTVTAIRSTASILSDGADIDPEWQKRFLRNMREESRRLSSSAQGLVDYLDAGDELEATPLVPQEELVAFLDEHDFHFSTLEGGELELGERVSALIAGTDKLQSNEARQIAHAWLERYVADAMDLPIDEFVAAWDQHPGDIARLVRQFGSSIPQVLRRVTTLPESDGQSRNVGLLQCDGAGAITFRKPVAGFPLPRFGAGCPLWPLYTALARPGLPVSALVEMGARTPKKFRCMAYAGPVGEMSFDAPPILEVTMLILPEDETNPFEGEAIRAGSSCRVCAREHCPARREPSILTGRTGEGT